MAATKIEKVKDNLYIITGSGAADMDAFSGGNTAVFITDTGVTLVDTKLPGWGPTILERVKSVTNKPITRVINTHTHSDHTGSNEFFGAAVESVVQENTKTNMAKMDEFKGAKAKFLPNKTYKDKLTLGSGKDQIDLYHFGPGHTNGDTFVVFTAARTMHTGDMFAWKALPYIDPDNGGSVVEHPKTLTRVLDSREERRHRDQRPHPRRDVERPARVPRLQRRLRGLRGALAQGRQERGAGREGYTGAAPIQGLRPQREPCVRRAEAEPGDRLQGTALR